MRPANFKTVTGKLNKQTIPPPLLGSIVRIENKSSYRGINISMFPPALRLLIADIFLDVGIAHLVLPGDYFKILKSTNINETSMFTN